MSMPILAAFVAVVLSHAVSITASSLTLDGKPSSSEYGVGETITFSYASDQPYHDGDGVVAIFPSSRPPSPTTSNSFVRTTAAKGTVVFSAATKSCAWPLQPGSYYAVLLDVAGYPQTERRPFTISASGAAAAEVDAQPKDAHATLSLLSATVSASGSPLAFHFTNPQAAAGDRIGIWPAGAWAWASVFSTKTTAPTTTWVRLCGSSTCDEAVESGQVTVSSEIKGIVWPLADGEYVAVVLDSEGRPKSASCAFTLWTLSDKSSSSAISVARRLLAI